MDKSTTLTMELAAANILRVSLNTISGYKIGDFVVIDFQYALGKHDVIRKFYLLRFKSLNKYA